MESEVNKHLRPSEITRSDYWTIIDADDHETFTSLAAAKDVLERSYAGTTIWHCVPSEGSMRDITSDLARDWFEAADIYDNAPDAYAPYVGNDVMERRDELETTASFTSQHSTQYRGAGL
jgi:hypothetical protein